MEIEKLKIFVNRGKFFRIDGLFEKWLIFYQKMD